MGYTITMTRPGGGIGVEDWEEAVREQDGVRLADGVAPAVTNPVTDETISRPARRGDAEWQDPATGDWLPAMAWREGAVSLSAPRDFDDAQSPLRVTLRALAERLGADVTGEEGEAYP